MNPDPRNNKTGNNRDEVTSCTLPQDTRQSDEMTAETAVPPRAPAQRPAPAPIRPQIGSPQDGGIQFKSSDFLMPGTVLGRCRIEKLLGRGGMGAVYLARHTTLDIPVAVKVMFPEITIAKPEFSERFMREAKLASRIRQSNVIQVMEDRKSVV